MSLILIDMPSLAFAQTDPEIVKQQTECKKSTAKQWDSATNKCVGKAEAIEKRHEADACNKLEDLSQRETCHKKLAEKATGLSSDPGSLNRGSSGATMIGLAFILIQAFSGAGISGIFSPCTSIKIFGITSAAALATDLYLKMEARKKVKALGDKYHLDAKSSASNSQIKALEYLKEEQQTVADIAKKEKQRNMLIMAGYAAAGIAAVIELGSKPAHPECFPTKSTAEKTPAKEGGAEWDGISNENGDLVSGDLNGTEVAPPPTKEMLAAPKVYSTPRASDFNGAF